MNYVQVNKDSFDLITHFMNKYGQYIELLESIESNLNLRLWHQLSDDLISFSSKHELENGTDLIELYNRVIMSVEKAFNPMKLMILINNVIKNFNRKFLFLYFFYFSLLLDNLEEALLFLDSISLRIDNKGEEYIYLQLLKVIFFLLK